MKLASLKPLALLAAISLALSACVVAPPHVRYAQASAPVVVHAAPAPAYSPVPAPVYAPPPVVYVQPPAPVYYNPWFIPNIGLNLWWGRQWGGHHHHRR